MKLKVYNWCRELLAKNLQLKTTLSHMKSRWEQKQARGGSDVTAKHCVLLFWRFSWQQRSCCWELTQKIMRVLCTKSRGRLFVLALDRVERHGGAEEDPVCGFGVSRHHQCGGQIPWGRHGQQVSKQANAGRDGRWVGPEDLTLLS